MEPLYKPLYLIVAPADHSRGLPPGYYAPISDEDYEAGILNPGLKDYTPKGWEFIVTDEYLYPLYSSKTNKRLRKSGLDIRPGDGLKAFQKAAIENVTDETARWFMSELHHYRDRAKSSIGVIRQHHYQAPNWSAYINLVKLGWLEETLGESVGYGMVRRGYRATAKGWDMIQIAAAVYGWT